MKRDAENDNLAMGGDMLAPEGYGEIVGGGQREDAHQGLDGGEHLLLEEGDVVELLEGVLDVQTKIKEYEELSAPKDNT